MKICQKGILVALVFIVGLMVSCASNEESNQSSDPQSITESDANQTSTTSVFFSLALIGLTAQEDSLFSGNAFTDFRTLNARGTIEDIASVTVVIQRSDDHSQVVPEIHLQEMNVDPYYWEGSSDGLPTGISLDFHAYAKDDASQDIFTDTVTQTLVSSGFNQIIFDMESIDDGIQPNNPRIISARIPAEIEVDSSADQLFFSIEHTGIVNYTVSVIKGIITSPTSGTHDPTSDLVVTYSSPSTVGVDTIKLTVKDPNASDTVSYAFPITIVDTLVSSEFTVLFGPAITAMNFLRMANGLEVSINVDSSNDASGDISPDTHSYLWSGTGDFAALSGTTNPFTISPFYNTDSGSITATVTAENGIQAALTRIINAWDFPFSIIIPVPDTGQTTCFNGSGTVITCPLPGQPLAQDGSYSINPQSYRDNLNETVSDLNTGLMWQQFGSNMMAWDGANTYCVNSDLAGYDDWRLPNVKEVRSLVRLDQASELAMINRSYFPETNRNFYWSSSFHLNDPANLWSVHFSSTYTWLLNLLTSNTNVRCVRGRDASEIWQSDFENLGNGMIRHGSTGLTWQREDGGLTRTWEAALNHCEGLSSGGYNDWRLPNISELHTIVDYGVVPPTIDQTYFPLSDPSSNSYFWSSTTDVNSPAGGWTVVFSTGAIWALTKSSSAFTRCVRGGR